MHMLAQRLADALRDAAVDLAVDDERIDRAADVVDRRVFDDLDHAGVGIDLHLADMRAVGKARGRDGLVALRGERAAQILRQIGALHRGARDLENADRVVGALHGKAAILEFDVGGRSLQQVLGDTRALLDDVVG